MSLRAASRHVSVSTNIGWERWLALGGTRKRLIWTTLAAVVLSALGFITLGLPGFGILAAATALAGLLGAPELGGDQVWPAALAMSMLGPFVLVPIYLGIARMVASRRDRILLTAAVTLAVDVILCCAGLLLLPRS